MECFRKQICMVGPLLLLFVFLICILCLLPCLTTVKFVRCSFIVVSCTPIGVSEINYLTYLTCRCCVPCLPNKPEACHSSDWHRPVHHVVWRPTRGNCFLSLPSYRWKCGAGEKHVCHHHHHCRLLHCFHPGQLTVTHTLTEKKKLGGVGGRGWRSTG